MKKPLAGLTLKQLEEILINEYAQPAFRAKQIYEWIYKGAQIQDMRNIPLELRNALEADYTASALEIVEKQSEQKSGTIKYLLKTKDDIIIECVVLSYEHGSTICVSTQAGCAMGCTFCASGKDGLYRNLSAGEMISQLICVTADTKQKIANIVMMGSGEPLNNYKEVLNFILLANDKMGFNIGIRHITISTCGIIQGIKKLIEDKIFVNLSVSLHSPLSQMRSEMMPIEKKNPISEVVKTCEAYREASGRRITYEYCVIENLNDTTQCADALYRLIGHTDAHVNLIGINDGNGVYGKNNAKAVEEFADKLKKRDINCTIRRKLGSSINAACGQLKSRYLTK